MKSEAFVTLLALSIEAMPKHPVNNPRQDTKISAVRSVSALLALLRTYTYTRDSIAFREKVLSVFVNVTPSEWEELKKDMLEGVALIGPELISRDGKEWIYQLDTMYAFHA